jgi:hypothetical protein
MFVHFGVFCADGRAGAAGSLANFNLIGEQAPVGFCLAYQDMTGRLANIRTIEIGTDTVGKLFDHLLGQASIGASSAGSRAQDAGFHTLGQLGNL